MMKKIVASPYRKLKLLFVLPVFAINLYAFASPNYSYETNSGPMVNPSLTSVAIQKDAKGVVVNEEGKPLQGVAILVAKSLTRAITDVSGRFSITRIPDGSSLIFSCKGYKTYTMPPLMASNSALYVRLVKDPDYKDEKTDRNHDGNKAEAFDLVDDEIPLYPGGEVALLKFIAENTQYPEAAKADSIQGKVIVRFIVNTEGNTERITVGKGVHPLLDAEAVRVVKLISGFKPGMHGGKAVNVWYMVPVNFILPQ